MKNTNIINIGKIFFISSFVLGSICLLGFLLSKNSDFAVAGYLMLIYGTIFNLAAILCLSIYAFIKPQFSKECIQAILYMLINIPIALLYAVLGISLM